MKKTDPIREMEKCVKGATLEHYEEQRRRLNESRLKRIADSVTKSEK